MSLVKELQKLDEVSRKINELRVKISELEEIRKQIQDHIIAQLHIKYGHESEYKVGPYEVKVIDYIREYIPADALKELKKNTELWPKLAPVVKSNRVMYLKVKKS